MDFQNNQLNDSGVNTGSSSGPSIVNSNNPFQAAAQNTQNAAQSAQSTAQDTVPTPSDNSSTAQAKLQNARDTVVSCKVCLTHLAWFQRA